MTNSSNLYLRLFHGRNAPDDVLDDWGFDGPIIGPVGITWTYGWVKLHSPDWEEMEHMPCVNDLIHYDGKYYGDFEIFVEGDACIEANRMAGVPLHKYPDFVNRLEIARRATT